MALGDVNSTEKGSGARYNGGKPPLDLIPLRLIAMSMPIPLKSLEGQAFSAMLDLSTFQVRPTGSDDVNTLRSVAKHLTPGAWVECAQVFEYGKKKYAAWNWAKGMSWSAVIGCAARHLFAMIQGEVLDPESGLPHRGHVMCNIVMLMTYIDNYPEGDDRPPVGLFDLKVKNA